MGFTAVTVGYKSPGPWRFIVSAINRLHSTTFPPLRTTPSPWAACTRSKFSILSGSINRALSYTFPDTISVGGGAPGPTRHSFASLSAERTRFAMDADVCPLCPSISLVWYAPGHIHYLYSSHNISTWPTVDGGSQMSISSVLVVAVYGCVLFGPLTWCDMREVLTCSEVMSRWRAGQVAAMAKGSIRRSALPTGSQLRPPVHISFQVHFGGFRK